MSVFFNNFHFLRPWWLLGFVPVVALLLYYYRALRQSDSTASTFAPHLLPYLLVRDKQDAKIQPRHLLPVFWLFCVLALSGPSWQQEPSPFAEDQAALVIVLKATKSMTAKDIQPSRLQRAVHKIGDLLEMRQGGQTALIAYSGSSHLVMPLARDNSIIESFAAELSPDIMPIEGDAIAEALMLAADTLKQAQSSGAILLITDSINREHHPALQNLSNNGIEFPIQVLAVGAPPGAPIPADSPDAPALDISNIEDGAKILGGKVTEVRTDTSDIEEINSNIIRAHKTITNEGERWKDSGFLLVPLLTLLALPWCRRGWFLRWGGTF